jgi:hypothetical protein
MAAGIRRADVTPLFPEKLALTYPTSGGRSVGVVRSWTQATESVCLFLSVDKLHLEQIFPELLNIYLSRDTEPVLELYGNNCK